MVPSACFRSPWGSRIGLAPLLTAMGLLLLSVPCCRRAPLRDEIVSPKPSGFQLPVEEVSEADLARLSALLEENPGDPDVERELGIVYQRLSPPDRWAYLDEAIRHLEAAREKLPEDVKLLVYLGLSRAAKARDGSVPLLEKWALARRGFEFLDQALALDPENFSARLLRAKAQLLAPPILGRGQTLKADEIRLTRFLTDPRPSLPKHLQIQGFLFLGDYESIANKDAERARIWWLRVAEADTEGRLPEAVERRLAGDIPEF